MIQSKMESFMTMSVPDSVKDLSVAIIYGINVTFNLANKAYQTIPGSTIIYRYIRDSHQNDPFRTLLEILLVLFMIWYFNRRKYRPHSNQVNLTEKEIEELCQEWEPESLVTDLSEFDQKQLEKLPVQISAAGVKVKLSDGKERLNLASYNYLGLLNREDIKAKAIEALRKYGVGSCGPPGFYGTIDVHVQLEKKLAEFFGMENAIIYSQGFSTIASAIPAFAKRGDIIVADEGISLAVQKGLDISRSQVYFFQHNNMEDLEKVLDRVQKEELKKTKSLTRRFLVVEGLYVNSGEIAKLPKLIELKEKYKYRLILEESYSFGALGDHGKGITEYYSIPANKVDILCASMCHVLGSSGGFVCGSNEIVEHQRLSGQAYTFSASLPALLAVSAIEALAIIKRETPALALQLHSNLRLFRQVLMRNRVGFDIKAAENSPILHLRFSKRFQSREEEEKALQDVVDISLRDGVFIVRSKYCHSQEMKHMVPSIRIVISAGMSKKDIEKAANVIRDAFKKSNK